MKIPFSSLNPSSFSFFNQIQNNSTIWGLIQPPSTTTTVWERTFCECRWKLIKKLLSHGNIRFNTTRNLIELEKIFISLERIREREKQNFLISQPILWRFWIIKLTKKIIINFIFLQFCNYDWKLFMSKQ